MILLISGNLSSRGNTEFFIQMGGATEVRQSDFITFINPYLADTLQTNPVRNLKINKGISLDFNLDINQNATVGIVIDQESGNKLQGTGNGNIRVKIDQYSDIEIYGNYTVAEGFYNFVFQDVVQRKFEILRGALSLGMEIRTTRVSTCRHVTIARLTPS
ncbi:MAG: translocation/assembly module TamB domain-containing protein [Owenweeksia sp.]|nr:translocation/assembly module TamB domain-containing protein [Owenweeksia sp.]